MYSVVIADDELNICEGLKRVLENHCSSVVIKGLFYNGADLLNYLKHHHVDIIITDIRMPQATGLDVAKYVSQNNINSHIIITTGYKEFEYARQAISYHVDCLLTKPYASKELIAKIMEIENTIDKECETAIKEDKLYLDNWNVFKSKLTSIYNGEESSDLQHLSVEFRDEINISSFKCYEVTYTAEPENTLFANQAIADFCEYVNKDKIVCQIFNSPEQIVCIVFSEKSLDITSLIEELIQSIRLHYGSNLQYSYLSFSDIALWSKYCLSRKISEEYFTNLSNNDHNYALSALNDRISTMSSENLFSLYQYLITLSDAEFTDLNICEENVKTSDITTVLRQLYDLSKPSLSKSDNLISMTMKYIDEHFSNPDLSLTEIADSLSVNSNYLCQVINKKTGKRFVDLILHARMEHAKKLLIEQDIPIKELALLVGYNQVPYFRQLFKNYFGITPTEYKIKVQNNL